ncbi:hypothetical protein Tco_1559140, partial [Tanacetum coccineum]
MFDIDYLTDSMNYIPVSLENQAKPHAGTSAVTTHAGISKVTNSAGTPNTNISEEEDEGEELIIVPTAVQHTKEASPNGISEDSPDILAFRKELDAIAQKHLGAALQFLLNLNPYHLNLWSTPMTNHNLHLIDNLEKELKDNKQTTTAVIVKLVKKVKRLETRVKYGNLP